MDSRVFQHKLSRITSVEVTNPARHQVSHSFACISARPSTGIAEAFAALTISAATGRKQPRLCFLKLSNP